MLISNICHNLCKIIVYVIWQCYNNTACDDTPFKNTEY